MGNQYSTSVANSVLNRRRFLRYGFGAFAGSLLAERLIADPFAPLQAAPVTGLPIRVRAVRYGPSTAESPESA